MSIKKLIVCEFEALGNGADKNLEAGEKYSYFQDPKTGKFYRPKKSFVVKGDHLETMFEEVVDKTRLP